MRAERPVGPDLGWEEAELDRGVPERFQRVLAALPGDRLAYSDAESSLTFRELDEASSRVGSRIVDRLGRADSASQRPVALLLPHSSSVLTATLGALRAGHFYIPLDAAQGPAFLKETLVECEAPILIAARSLESLARELIDRGGATELLFLEDLLQSGAEALPPLEAGSETLASVVFTSGSTGRPRGILRTHGQIISSAYRMTSYGAYRGGRVAFLTTYAQAFSGLTTFGAFLTGSTVFGKELRATDPGRLCSWLREERITFLSCPPGILRSIAEMEDCPPFTDLRAIHSGMEPLSRRDVEALSRKLPLGCAMIFLLAASESSMTHFLIENGAPWEGDSTPAGYADLFTEVFIADEKLEPVPHGAIGQICIRSKYISPGYWKGPEETERRFLKDPLDPRLRTFLSGDLGVMRADGLLEHRGRMDFMLKIRGHRIEPAAIEQALNAHPAIAESIVLAFPAKSGNSRLAAYCARRPGMEASASELRDYLLASLPPSMLPSRFVFLEALPRNLAAKIDRGALPPPGTARPDIATPFVEPEDEMERAIADLWCEILDIDEVGRHDNFFLLGGDSLSALEMSYRAEKVLGGPVRPEYFDQPTIANLREASSGEAGRGEPDNAQDSGPVAPSHKRPSLRRLLLGLARAIFSAAASLGLGLVFYRGFAKVIRITDPIRLFKRSQYLEFESVYGSLVNEAARDQDPADAAALARQIRLMTVLLGLGFERLGRENLKRIVDVDGIEGLRESLAEYGSAVCVSYHSELRRLNGPLFELAGIPTVGVFPPKDEGASRAETASMNTITLKRAESSLRRGRTVRIFPDGDRGTAGLTLEFLGRARIFYSGFAELACRARVPVHGFSITMDRGGRIRFSVSPAFAAGEDPRRESRVETLQREYLRFLEERWRKSPGNLMIGFVRSYLDRTGPFAPSDGIADRSGH